MSDRLDIKTEMRALDLKDREFYDSLTDEERKKFSAYMMMKWSANVEGQPELQEWYIRAHNERVNQNFFDVGREPKLQWLLCTTVSPGMGSQRHYWLKAKSAKQDRGTANRVKFLSDEYPMLKDDEVELLAQLITMEQCRQYARDSGWEDRQIKDELSM